MTSRAAREDAEALLVQEVEALRERALKAEVNDACSLLDAALTKLLHERRALLDSTRQQAEEGEQAALALMVILGPLAADAAIVGRTYGWNEVIGVAKGVEQRVRQLHQENARLKTECSLYETIADNWKDEAEAWELRALKAEEAVGETGGSHD